MHRKLHPFNALVLIAILMTAVLLAAHPLHALLLTLALSGSVFLVGGRKELSDLLRFWIFTGLLILLVNPLVSTQGKTVLYRTALPIFGRIRVTAESLAFGGAMVLRLFSMVLSVKLFGLVIDRDDFFGYLSRYMNKLVLTMSMTVNMIHRLRVDMARVRDVMAARGLAMETGSVVRRAKAAYPMVKVVLISSLEGSVNRAEALFSRGYGKGPRSFYSEIRMSRRDRFQLAVAGLYVAVFALGLLKGQLGFEYFPSLEAKSAFSLAYFLFHGGSFALLMETTRRCGA